MFMNYQRVTFTFKPLPSQPRHGLYLTACYDSQGIYQPERVVDLSDHNSQENAYPVASLFNLAAA